ncbi:hypothetical protein ZIOFF_063028 [Zingiber officinale]|uniref:UVR domain-containing protein n=1 Tax=Zingiber officinale TaxID=94328 RepID=A0A8J5KB16_ZINOF|nr:hypothetical protein ZIOFF_063028 [Zingiber officinale]
MAVIVVAVLLFISSSPSLPSLSLISASSAPPSLSASLGGCSSSPIGSTSSSSLPAGPPGLTSLLRSSPASGSFSNSLFHQPSCSCKSTLQLSPPLFLFPLAQTHIHHSLEIWHIQGFVLITGYLLNPEISLNCKLVELGLHDHARLEQCCKVENLQKLGEDEEYARIMARLEELEKIEELENRNTSKDNTQKNEHSS